MVTSEKETKRREFSSLLFSKVQHEGKERGSFEFPPHSSFPKVSDNSRLIVCAAAARGGGG